MNRPKISVLALCLLLASKTSFAQKNSIDSIANTNYKSRKLKLEEQNFVTGYYIQDGNNAAVTGGIGDEHLTDVATTYNLTWVKYDKKNRKHSLGTELGVDVYSSASSDKIDPNTVSSASSSDIRIYPSINYSIQNDEKRYSIGAGYSFSREYDYTSHGVNLMASKWNKNRNSELTAKASIFFDQISVILPLELRPVGYGSGAENDPLPIDEANRTSYNFGLMFSQVITKNFQIALLSDISYQEGLLATRFHRVFFNNGNVKVENLPGTRLKIPLGIRANYYIGDRTVLRSFYRYYSDNWNINSHTISAEISYKITPFISLAPFYRFYMQTAAEHFSEYGTHNPNAEFYTSDFDLSKFKSNMFGLNLRFADLNGKLLIKKLNVIDLRYSYYERNNGFFAHSITLGLNFK